MRPPDTGEVADAIAALEHRRDANIKTLIRLGEAFIDAEIDADHALNYGEPRFDLVGHAAIRHLLGVGGPTVGKTLVEACEWFAGVLAGTDIGSLQAEKARRETKENF